MRLGDLDALKEAVENLVVGGAKGLKDYYENGSKSDENSWIGGIYDAWELIDNAPTVIWCSETPEGLPLMDLRERPQGEWIYNDYGNGCGNWHCSLCGCMPYYANDIHTLNFCPNCGANMHTNTGGKEE